MKSIKFIFVPFSFLYGCAVFIRNWLFDKKILSSEEFLIPLINVGNISAGGTGKSPHIEYLIRLLMPDFELATLSRGYGRKTKDFFVVSRASTAAEAGDEPCQFKKKFKTITVAVDNSRVSGIKKLMKSIASLEIVLLDDAFQHRAVTPGLSIVLTDYNNLFYNDYLLPVGTLREFKSGIERSHIIIVTKSPEKLAEVDRHNITHKINGFLQVPVFFSTIKYGKLVSFGNNLETEFDFFNKNYSVLMLTGIANTSHLENYLSDKFKEIVPIRFSDHHHFSVNELKIVTNLFNNIESENKIIITTEKDAMRLHSSKFEEIVDALPVFYLPIEIEFNQSDSQNFNQLIIDYVQQNKRNI